MGDEPLSAYVRRLADEIQVMEDALERCRYALGHRPYVPAVPPPWSKAELEDAARDVLEAFSRRTSLLHVEHEAVRRLRVLVDHDGKAATR